MKLTRKSIWNCAQNKPSQIVNDLLNYIWNNEIGVEGDSQKEVENVIYETLLRRGVFKWFGVRRKLIKLKNYWKEHETATISAMRSARLSGDHKQKHYLQGYLYAMQKCRADIQALCHSDRWQVPDHDSKAKQWLEKYELPEGVRIIPEPTGHPDRWCWTCTKGGVAMVGPFTTPEQAAADAIRRYKLADDLKKWLEDYKKQNESLRRIETTRDRSYSGYDANGSPVPEMRRWPTP